MDKRNSFRESLRRAQNAMNKATASIQGAIDNNQEAINRLNPNNPLVQYAQGVQDIANLAAHPVKTSKAVINQAKKEVKETIKNPVGTYLKNNPASVAYNTGKEIMKQGVPRTLGQMSATSLVPVKAPAKTPVKTVAPVKTPVGALVKVPVKAPAKTATPVGNSLGGDAVKAPVETTTPVKGLVETATSVKPPVETATPVGGSLGGDARIFSARPQALKFQASLLEQAGVPSQEAKQDIAQSISRNGDLPDNILGSYSTRTGEIKVSPNTKIQQYGFSSFDVGTHETAHKVLHRLEVLKNAGLITPKGAEFLHNLMQSQSNKLIPLYKNEAVTRGFELARNPNLKFNKQTLNRLMLNLSDIENAAKVISPYYRDFLKGGM